MMNNAPAKGLAERLDAWPKARVWLIILVAALGLLLVDLTFPGVDTGPLYVPLVCAAAWAFRRRESLLVAALATASNFIPLVAESHEAATRALIGSAAVRYSILVFVIAIIVSFRRAYDRQRFLARRDPLTGAANKATFEQHADKVLDAPADRTLLLTTIDLDNFKTINDTHGHAAGDAVVRAFAAKVSAVTRKEDCLGRIGGDEFALLGPVISVEDGHTTAACLHQRLSSMLSELPYPVTISMGAVVIPPKAGLDRATLMNHADQLMYAVKRTGKGAVMVDTVGAPEPSLSTGKQDLHVAPSRVAA